MGRTASDSVLFDHEGSDCKDRYHRRCTGRWRGVVSLGKDDDGKRVRKKVSGATKSEVLEKLRNLHKDLDQGVRPRAGYTVHFAIEDYLAKALDGRAPKTVQTYRECLAPLDSDIGPRRLTELSSDHVRSALLKIGKTRSTRTVQIAHQQLRRVIKFAMARDLVGRNVADYVSTVPGATPGRPSRSLTVAQARKLVQVAEASTSWIGPYVILCLMSGIRTEEARALRWSEVDLMEPSVAVYRSVRAHGDTKTRKSRRKLLVGERAAQALERQQEQQAADRENAGEKWRASDLVFTSSVGTPLDAHNVRRAFRDITEAATSGSSCTGPPAGYLRVAKVIWPSGPENGLQARSERRRRRTARIRLRGPDQLAVEELQLSLDLDPGLAGCTECLA
jgi:integrase